MGGFLRRSHKIAQKSQDMTQRLSDVTKHVKMKLGYVCVCVCVLKTGVGYVCVCLSRVCMCVCVLKTGVRREDAQ